MQNISRSLDKDISGIFFFFLRLATIVDVEGNPRTTLQIIQVRSDGSQV